MQDIFEGVFHRRQVVVYPLDVAYVLGKYGSRRHCRSPARPERHQDGEDGWMPHLSERSTCTPGNPVGTDNDVKRAKLNTAPKPQSPCHVSAITGECMTDERPTTYKLG